MIIFEIKTLTLIQEHINSKFLVIASYEQNKIIKAYLL